MTGQQDESGQQAPWRRATLILLGVIPIAVAGTAGLTAATYGPSLEPRPLALSADASDDTNTAPADDATSQIVAPGELAQVDVNAAIQVIDVAIPEPAAVEELPQNAQQPSTAGAAQSSGGQGSSSGSGSAAGSSGSSGSSGESAGSGASKAPSSSSGKTTTQKAAEPAPKKTETPSYTSFCSGASAASGPGGSVQGLLAAANAERARLGISPLSWNGSLATAATSWSQSMASSGNFGHNPKAPGAENVATSSNSGGISVSAGVNRAHANWMASSGHCRNIMNPGYSSMGAGAAQSADGKSVYVTVNFR